jgi:alpha-ribazole phosphatase
MPGEAEPVTNTPSKFVLHECAAGTAAFPRGRHGVGRIVFVRHGITAPQEQARYCGYFDPPLSAAGRMQAEAAGRRLRAERNHRIAGSDLRRAAETAQWIAPGSKYRALPELREISFGDWEGRTFAETGCDNADAMLQADFRFPGGESLSEMSIRVHRAMAMLLADPGAETLIVVGHSGSIAAAVCTLLGQPVSEWPRYRLPFGGIGELLSAGIELNPRDVSGTVPGKTNPGRPSEVMQWELGKGDWLQ